MDFVEGRSLADVLTAEERLDKQRSIKLIEQVCAGLHHAHQNQIVHRDVKPGNLMLLNVDGVETVKVVDFGIAKINREDHEGPNLTKTGEIFGTPLYMSPEQCLGHPVDHRADVYAVGCVLYELLVGKPPFDGKNSMEVLVKHLNATPDATGLDADITLVIRKAMSKDLMMRYSSLDELASDLRAISRGEPAAIARAEHSKQRTIKSVVVLLAVVLIAVVGLSAISVVQRATSDVQSTNQWQRFYAAGKTFQKSGKLVEAEEEFERSLKLAESSKNSTEMLLVLKELEAVEESLGKPAEARAHRTLMNSDKLLRQSRFKDMITLVSLLGMLLIVIGGSMIWLFLKGRNLKKLFGS